MKVIVAITGASGTIYARQVLEGLVAGPEVERVGVIVSHWGAEVAAWEGFVDIIGDSAVGGAAGGGLQGGDFVDRGRADGPVGDLAGGLAFGGKIEWFDNGDMFASPASGSAGWDAMVVVPASMGSVGRIAGGVSGDLISRAADVMLKEGRKLIIVPRETPLSLIHLRNLTTLAEAGAVVLPASPSFYSHPADIDALCATVSDRILARLGVKSHSGFEWGVPN